MKGGSKFFTISNDVYNIGWGQLGNNVNSEKLKVSYDPYIG